MKNSTLKNLAIFSSALFVGASAIYLYSPTFGSHADTSKTAEVTLNIGEVMSLSLDKNNLALAADINSFTSGEITATAITNAQYGYTLTLEDVDASSNLVHTNSSIDSVLTSNFAGAKTSAQMDSNTWGFSLDTTNFYKVPVSGSPVAIKRTNSPMATDSEDTVVTFGAKVGNITSGTYTDSVLFTIYTNGANGEPSDGTSVDEPGYISPCETAPYVTNGVLTDPRDGKTYTVMSAKDGHCWMTQNLALIDAELTSENSNLPEGETFTIPASATNNFSSNNNNAAYLHENATYGGFYSWYTATAGWGTADVTSGSSPKDICPKGWRLPTGGDDGEYRTLMREYYPGAYFQDPTPFFNEFKFVLSGEVDYGYVEAQGSRGFYWTSTASSRNNANFFYIANNMVNPSIAFDKFVGYTVRCINK